MFECYNLIIMKAVPKWVAIWISLIQYDHLLGRDRAHSTVHSKTGTMAVPDRYSVRATQSNQCYLPHVSNVCMFSHPCLDWYWSWLDTAFVALRPPACEVLEANGWFVYVRVGSRPDAEESASVNPPASFPLAGSRHVTQPKTTLQHWAISPELTGCRHIQ